LVQLRIDDRERMGEELLFLALAEAFATARASRVVSEVYHGSGHQVEFRDAKEIRRCELCDLVRKIGPMSVGQSGGREEHPFRRVHG